MHIQASNVMLRCCVIKASIQHTDSAAGHLLLVHSWLSGCRRLLREEVTSGRLDAATSKAAVLQELCDRLKFNPEAAGALHRSLYRQKMDDILKNHNKITGMRGHLFLAIFSHLLVFSPFKPCMSPHPIA